MQRNDRKLANGRAQTQRKSQSCYAGEREGRIRQPDDEKPPTLTSASHFSPAIFCPTIDTIRHTEYNERMKKKEEHRITIRLPNEYYEGLIEYAFATHVSVSDAIRFAIADFIEKNRQEEMKVKR